MSNRFENKVVLITGAGSGLGRAAAIEVANEGAKLALVDLNEETLEETKNIILKTAPQSEILLLSADVSNENEVKKYVKDTVSKFGRIDGFFNNAGIEGRQALLENYDSGVFSKVIDVNLKGVFYGLKYVLPVMKQQKQGYVVNTSSVGGLRAVLNQTAYVASKHAVAGMTKNAALEYAESGISVNAIAPSTILTNMVIGAFKQINPDNWEAAAADFAQGIPAKRMGQPEEVGRLVAFLLSGESPFINGTIIPIDGAQTAVL